MGLEKVSRDVYILYNSRVAQSGPPRGRVVLTIRRVAVVEIWSRGHVTRASEHAGGLLDGTIDAVLALDDDDSRPWLPALRQAYIDLHVAVIDLDAFPGRDDI